jgi:glycosyltransferase involved in cell wall biosynthesis
MSGRRIRVAHVIEAMHQGGAESLVVEHVRLAAPDVESWVVALNRGGPALDAAAAAGAHTLLLAKGGAIAGLSRLAKWLAAEHVDVVNGHNPTGGLYGALASAFAHVPVAIRTEHSFHYRGRHSALYPFSRFSPRGSRGAWCACEAVLESHIRRLPWAAGRFVSVANGISPAPHIRPRDVVRAGLDSIPGVRVALTVGSLTTQKAQHVLLEAWRTVASAVPGAMLLIAGEGRCAHHSRRRRRHSASPRACASSARDSTHRS